MSDAVITPANLAELRSLVASSNCLLAIGNRTKRPLSAAVQASLVSLRSICGMVQYEPSEFTFTARGGTPVAEIAAILAEKNQYLPFDPMLAGAGATIGGSIAAGLSGPGRFRFGGLRDFLLGVEFISGEGKLIRAGGKVVKNAAGFDLPKFMIGSQGRLGVMTEVTFKVFPKPAETQTLKVNCESHAQAVERMTGAAASTWELDAIDYRPAEHAVYLRVAGPAELNRAIANRIGVKWGADVSDAEDGPALWQSVVELNWMADTTIAVKVPITPSQIPAFCQSGATATHVSAAGNVAWVMPTSHDQLKKLHRSLEQHGLCGLVIRGDVETSQVGKWPRTEVASALKHALDPPGRFPDFPRAPHERA